MREFVFPLTPIVPPTPTPPPSDIDSGEETDPDDHEARIQSSWHHRALLGDENRIRYTEDSTSPEDHEDGSD